MSTRIVDRHGEPYPTREVRQRMGFIKGEVDADNESEPPSFKVADFEMPRLRETSENGEWKTPMAKDKR